MAWDDNNPGPWGKRPSSNHPQRPDDFEELIRRGQKKIKDIFPGNGGNPPSVNNPRFFIFATIIAVVIWLATGFYKVDTAEQGVVLQFGKYSRTTNPGLNYHLPYPFEQVIKLEVTTINKEEIGYRSASPRSRDTNIREVPQESLMLTGDENIVDVFFEVQWKVSNAENYLFNIRDLGMESTVKTAAESAMREVIGKTPIASTLAEGRSAIEFEAKNLLQNVLDSYQAGIDVVRLQMLKVDPPAKVIDAFRDVQTARADKEREINQAQSYRNDVVPRARGEAKKIVLGAEGYKAEVTNRAQGDADRFLSVYEQYINAKDITKRRMYLETMENILRDTKKVIVDSKGTQGVLPYLPLSALEKTKQ